MIHHILAQWRTAVHHMVADNPGTAAVVDRSPVGHMTLARTVDFRIHHIGFGRTAGRGHTGMCRIRWSRRRAAGRIDPYLRLVMGIDRLLLVGTVPRIRHVLVPIRTGRVDSARCMR